MRKIYSLVLMAAMLLVGTNAWANYPSSWLQDQFDAVPADGQTHTITMQDNIVLTDPVYLGTASVDDPRKSIILDMNGHHITMDATTWVKTKGNVFCSMFTITHGELLIRNNNKSVTSTISMTGKGYDYIGSDSKRNLAQYNNIFNVAGSYKSSRWVKSGNTYEIDENAAINTRDKGWFTHLEIGEGVKVVAENTIYGAGISIDGYYTNYHAMISNDATATTGVFDASLNGSFGNVCLYNRSDAPAYNTAILSKASEGVAYGVRVDVYGDIEFATAATEGKAYGIKLNGGLRSSLRENEIFLNQYCWNMDEAYARTYGATAAPTTKATKSFVIGETAYNNHYNDTVDAPFLYIHSTAHIIAAAELNEATAVYCSGYGKTLIEGACSGNSGINIKAGTVELHDAEITGTATTYENAEQGNHATGSGGIVVNSVDNRAGGIEVVISGDTKVSTTVGYAIEEVVNKTNGEGTDVSSIDIQGGTIEGGNLGAIALTTEAGNATAITGGNVSGPATVGDNEVEISDLVPQNEDYHTTTVTDGNKTIIVVSEGAAPTGQETVMGGVLSVNWKHNDASTTAMTETIKANIPETDTVVTLTELEINQSYAQTLTIKSGSELNVGRVVLGTNAQIIVEPGAVFNVTGDQGIVAPVVSNIVLRAEPGKPSIFLFKPQVTSNRHPNATVEFITNSYYTNSSDFRNQRMGIPAYEGISSMTVKSMDGATNIPTGVAGYINGEWNILGYLNVAGQPSPVSKMTTPFAYYQLSCNVPEGTNSRVTMTGALVGNVNHTFSTPAGGGWSTFANSYSGIMDAEQMMNMFPALATIDQTIWTYKTTGSGTEYAWKSFNYTNIAAGKMGNLDPMQAFLLKTDAGAEAVELELNYENMVYNPRLTTSVLATAPARAESDMMVVSINVSRDQDWKDGILMLEGSQFSADYENGFDAEKCMTEFVNLYVTADRNYSNFVTNNLKHTFIGFSSVQGGTYELSFEDVADSNYDLIDMVSNQRVSLNAGNTYTFTVDDNYVNDYRFEIVERQNMPTDIDVVEQNVQNTNGIYTITGQYLGNMSVWNSLPAGMYIVDGVKKVK